jgi:hypothetical protein
MAHHIGLAQTGTGDECILHMTVEIVFVPVEYGGNAALRPVAGTVNQASFSDDGYSTLVCQ